MLFRSARQQFIECMKIERDRNWLKGYVGYNASLPVKLRINVGKRLYRLTFPLKLVNCYEDAVALAVNLVKPTGGNGVKNVRNRSWLLELEGYSAKFELIGDDTLYNNAEGVLRAECVDPFFKFYEQVLSEAGLISKKPYFRIVNWKNLQRTAWSARKLYINRMTRLNKEIPCRYSVLYGLNGFMKTLVNSSRMFSPFKLVVADDFESAMALIEKEKDQLNSSLSLHREPLRFAADETVRIDHINQLLAFIGRLNWDTNGIEIEENERPISEEFLPLYQSISLIKQDFDGILQEKTSAQKQLKQSEKKYRTIIESINDGYYEVDLHGKITFCNHALSKLLGVSKKKLPGMNFRQFANRKNYVKIVQYFKHFYETGESESVLEWELEKKDGKKIFVDTSVSLIQDNESKPQGFRGMVRDITDRIQSENKILETSKDLENLNDELEVAIERSNKMVAESAMAYLELDQIFRASTEGIWVVSQSFDIFRINKMLLSIIGKTQEEIKGKKCYEDRKSVV